MEKGSDTRAQKAKDKWDKIYQKIGRKVDHGADNNIGPVANPAANPAACEVLIEYQYLLPPAGSALDVACGLGGNSLFLAERGLEVTAIDISTVAINFIESRQHRNITTRCASIDRTFLSQQRYDIIVVSRYLDRSICSALIDSLNPQGLLFYQTFTREKANPDIGPGNPEYLLASNELLSLFSDLTVLAFTDQGTVGAHDSGFRNQSYLVAQKR